MMETKCSQRIPHWWRFYINNLPPSCVGKHRWKESSICGVLISDSFAVVKLLWWSWGRRADTEEHQQRIWMAERWLLIHLLWPHPEVSITRISQNHQMVEIWRDLFVPLVQPLLKQGHPEQGTQIHVQVHFEGSRFHNISGQPMPVLTYSHCIQCFLMSRHFRVSVCAYRL